MKNTYISVDVLRLRDTDRDKPPHVVITGVGPFGGSRASLTLSYASARHLARRIIEATGAKENGA